MFTNHFNRVTSLSESGKAVHSEHPLNISDLYPKEECSDAVQLLNLVQYSTVQLC